MSDILQFKKPLDAKARELHDLGLTIDGLVLDYVGKGFELFEVSGILAHRLGECIRNLPDKDKALDILIDVILKKADQPNG